MTTKYRVRKRSDFDGTWFYVDKLKPTGNWWPVGCYATEERALEIFETIGNEQEKILKEKEVPTQTDDNQ